MATVTNMLTSQNSYTPQDAIVYNTTYFLEFGTSVAYQEAVALSSGSHILVHRLEVKFTTSVGSLYIGSNGVDMWSQALPVDEMVIFDWWYHPVVCTLSQNMQIKKDVSSSDIVCMLWWSRRNG